MEPSSGDDGGRPRGPRRGGPRPCFNGAVVRGRRRGGTAVVGGRGRRLQWSRRPGTTESRRWATQTCPMRPLQWSRRPGTTESTTAAGSWSIIDRFNGAVVRGRRRVQRRRTRERLSPRRFNGAVVRGRRRGRVGLLVRAYSKRFNGAVVRGRRRGAAQVCVGQVGARASMEPSSGDDGERPLDEQARHRALAALQWSRRPGTTERRPRRTISSEHSEASMEPSSGDDGELSRRCRFARRDNSGFNGAVVRGRRRVGAALGVDSAISAAASMEPSSGDDGEAMMHGYIGASGAGASMEPSSGDDGERGRTVSYVGAGEWVASMEPSSGDDGESPAHGQGPQNDRASMEPSSGDDGEASWKRWRDRWGAASMEPSSGDDGEVAAATTARHHPGSLQWSRRPGTTERRVYYEIGPRAPGWCFNGAVVRGRRRAGHHTTESSRCVVPLQWSRRPGTTERGWRP